MCDMTGWEVHYESDDRATISPHSYRIIDCGAGMTFDEACDMVADHYEDLAKQWRNKTHYDYQWYMG